MLPGTLAQRSQFECEILSLATDPLSQPFELNAAHRVSLAQAASSVEMSFVARFLRFSRSASVPNILRIQVKLVHAPGTTV